MTVDVQLLTNTNVLIAISEDNVGSKTLLQQNFPVLNRGGDCQLIKVDLIMAVRQFCVLPMAQWADRTSSTLFTAGSVSASMTNITSEYKVMHAYCYWLVCEQTADDHYCCQPSNLPKQQPTTMEPQPNHYDNQEVGSIWDATKSVDPPTFTSPPNRLQSIMFRDSYDGRLHLSHTTPAEQAECRRSSTYTSVQALYCRACSICRLFLQSSLLYSWLVGV